jgi:predicted transcriptional regulator
MKLAISVPDHVHRAADRVARRLRVPRSRLYVKAMESFLESVSDDDVTRRLDEVFADGPGAPDPFLAGAARGTLRRSR